MVHSLVPKPRLAKQLQSQVLLSHCPCQSLFVLWAPALIPLGQLWWQNSTPLSVEQSREVFHSCHSSVLTLAFFPLGLYHLPSFSLQDELSHINARLNMGILGCEYLLLFFLLLAYNIKYNENRKVNSGKVRAGERK